MHTVVLKKNIKTEFIVEDLAFVNLDNHVEYSTTQDGVNAIGYISLKGQYYNGGKYAKFNERIDVDIFVPSEKITSRSSIEIKINDFDYMVDNDQIQFSIKVDICGLKDDIKTFPTAIDDLPKKEEEILENTVKTDTICDEKIKEETKSIIDEFENQGEKEIHQLITPIEPRVVEKMPSKIFKQPDSTQVCWSYKVVLKDDTYESISDELEIDSMKLRSINNNKPLKEGMLIKLP